MSSAAVQGTRRASSRLSAGRGAAAAAPMAAVAEPAKKRAAPAAPVASSATKKAKEEAKPAKSPAKSGLLQAGDRLPSLSLQDQAGRTVKIAGLRKAVIFTYPKANTGGCTKQACIFRDSYADWQKAGFAVYGLSNDGTTSLKNWKEKREFQYDLLSDPKRELIGQLTGSKTSTPRSHFVIDANGALALSSISVKPADSSPDALKFAQSL